MIRRLENLLIPAMMVAFCFLLEICHVGTATKNYFILTIISVCIYTVIGLYEAIVIQGNSKKSTELKKENERIRAKKHKGFTLSQEDIDTLEENDAKILAFQEMESIFKKRGGWDILFSFAMELVIAFAFMYLLKLDFFTIYLLLDVGSGLNDTSDDSGFRFSDFSFDDDDDDEEDEDDYDEDDDDDFDDDEDDEFDDIDDDYDDDEYEDW